MVPDHATAPAFQRAFLFSYGLGILLCVIWPLVLQGLLGSVLQPGSFGRPELAEDLGYTFTGLVILSILFVRWRFANVRAGFAALTESRQVRVMALEILLYAAIFELSALFGLIYHGLGGPQAERYARTFIGLATVMFFVFVPRLAAWRRALQG
jgi:hypothetical protein